MSVDRFYSYYSRSLDDNMSLMERKRDLLELNILSILNGLEAKDVSRKEREVFGNIENNPYSDVFGIYPVHFTNSNYCLKYWDLRDKKDKNRIIFNFPSFYEYDYHVTHKAFLKEPENMALDTEISLLEGLYKLLSKLFPRRIPLEEDSVVDSNRGFLSIIRNLLIKI